MPGCEARSVQVPVVIKVTVEPDTEQVVWVVELNTTGSPELADAVRETTVPAI